MLLQERFRGVRQVARGDAPRRGVAAQAIGYVAGKLPQALHALELAAKAVVEYYVRKARHPGLELLLEEVDSPILVTDVVSDGASVQLQA